MTISRTIAVQVQFKWDGVNWVDETGLLKSASGALEHQPLHEAYASGKQVIQQAVVRLANRNHRFSAWHSSSILYPYRSKGGSYYAEGRIRVSVDGGSSYTTIFTGFVKAPQENFLRNEVSFTIWDLGEKLQQKLSCSMLTNYMEHEVVAYYLTLAGLTDGIEFVSPAYVAANGGVATIDYSSVKIPYSWLDDEPIWSELADLAQASGARVYTTPGGQVKYEKGYRWAIPGAVETVTPDEYADLEPVYDDKAFYDEVLIEYSERIPGTTVEELWKQERPLLIPPGKSEALEARLRYPAITITPPVPNEDYFARSLSGADLSGSVSIGYNYAAQRVTLTITNNASSLVVVGKLSLKGQPLLGQPSKQIKKATGAANYNRRLEVRGNPYMQSQIQAEGVAGFLAWWHATVKTSWRVKGLRGLPTRVLGSHITVKAENQTIAGIVTKVDWLIGVSENGGAVGYRQDITLVEDVFTGAGDTYFTVGVSLLNGSDGVWF